MKLIDILVRKLPKLGGWNALFGNEKNDAVQESIMELLHISFGTDSWSTQYIESDDTGEVVTREQYEAALAVSTPEWNGGGLPPVGSAFEFRSKVNSLWKRGVMCVVGYTTPFNVVVDDQCGIYRVNELLFRPIRSEADKKRDEAAKGLIEYLDKETDIDNVFSIKDVIGFYDAIAAGKIPHIRID